MSASHERPGFDLALAPGATIEDAAEAIAARLTIGVAPDSPPEERRYLDTFDGLLRAAGLTVMHAGARLVLAERHGETEVASEPLPVAPVRALASELPLGELRTRLRRVADVRALLPVASVTSRRHVLAVLDGEAKTVARIVLEQPSLIVAESGRLVPLTPRARVESLRGYAREARRVHDVLAGELGLALAVAPLVDEATRAAGRDPAGVSAKVDVALDPAARSDHAAACVLRRLAEIVAANLPGTVADVDPEFLHDLRVAVRRSRSVQRQLRDAFPAGPLAFWRGELKWLQGITGDARDADVHLLEFDELASLVPEAFRGDLEPLRTVLRRRRLAARRAMARELRSPRAEAILVAWPEFLAGLERLPEAGRPGAALPIAELAGARIWKVYRRMLRMGEAIDPDTPAETYHDLRKKGKELRYLLELFGVKLYDPEVVGPSIASLKRLQDVLGRHQDREVQARALRALAPEVATLPRGPEALLATGLLLERLHHDELAARGEFASRFASFSAKPQRRRLREAVGG